METLNILLQERQEHVLPYHIVSADCWKTYTLKIEFDKHLGPVEERKLNKKVVNKYENELFH